MGFIIKERARTYTASGPVSVGYYPNGVGGPTPHAPAVLIQVGEHKLFMTADEWGKVSGDIWELINQNQTGGA